MKSPTIELFKCLYRMNESPVRKSMPNNSIRRRRILKEDSQAFTSEGTDGFEVSHVRLQSHRDQSW